MPNNYNSLQASSTGKSFVPQQSGTSALFNRRGLMNALSGTFAATMMFSQPALAEIDYDGVKYLGGGDKVDVNNANIRAYVKMPGMYPNVAGKIIKALPPPTIRQKGGFQSYDDMMKMVAFND